MNFGAVERVLTGVVILIILIGGLVLCVTFWPLAIIVGALILASKR